jgi:hypothetical protein
MIVDKENGNDGHSWDNTAPTAIVEYEIKQIKKARREITKEETRAIIGKKFCQSLPADLLYNYNTGSVIHFTAYGYPVVATCREEPSSAKSFAEDFEEQIDCFKAESSFASIDNFGTDKQELIDAKILKILPENYHHGRNGFVSMEALLFENKKQLYGSQFNYVTQRQLGIKPRAHASAKKIENENETSDESNSSQEDPQACTIS